MEVVWEYLLDYFRNCLGRYLLCLVKYPNKFVIACLFKMMNKVIKIWSSLLLFRWMYKLWNLELSLSWDYLCWMKIKFHENSPSLPFGVYGDVFRDPEEHNRWFFFEAIVDIFEQSNHLGVINLFRVRVSKYILFNRSDKLKRFLFTCIVRRVGRYFEQTKCFLVIWRTLS